MVAKIRKHHRFDHPSTYEKKSPKKTQHNPGKKKKRHKVTQPPVPANGRRHGKMPKPTVRAELRFWSHFGGKKVYVSSLPKPETLAILREFADLVICKQGRRGIWKVRGAYKERRESLHSIRLYKTCFVCAARATCRHHVIQIQHGGRNQPNNLVSLCTGCHEAIHPWMATKQPASIV